MRRRPQQSRRRGLSLMQTPNRGCGETWPLDGEFWYFDRKGKPMGHGRACWAEHRHRTVASFLGGRPL